jgi:hypothetical protein
MEEFALRFALALAADDQRVLVRGHCDLVVREPGHGQGKPELVVVQPDRVERRVVVALGLGAGFQQIEHAIEAGGGAVQRRDVKESTHTRFSKVQGHGMSARLGYRLAGIGMPAKRR